MSNVGPGSVIEEPAQSTSRSNLSLRKQPQVPYPEGGIVDDEENSEFKLPRMGSLVVVLMTNVLMQVTPCIPPTQQTSLKTLLDLLFHYRSVLKFICRKLGRRRDVFWTSHRYPDSDLSFDPCATFEVR